MRVSHLQRLAVILPLLLLCCERGRLRPTLGELEVSPPALDFGPAFVGFPIERPVVLRNKGVADRPLAVTAPSPFSVPEAVVVPGGSQLELKVRFAPLQEGAATGTLILSDGNESFEVTLQGTAASAPACSSVTPCQVSTFDPALGVCVEGPAPDHSTCVDTCIAAGKCSGGTCLGTAKDCGDSNPCTTDSCDSSSGCQHQPLECAAPADPCKVGRCDPTLGCVTSDARDGIPCGPADCTSAMICLVGECKVAAVPDGAKCSPATPCQGPGTCSQNSCVRPAATALVEAWSYEFLVSQWTWRGVTDPAQNLYWIECGSGWLPGVTCSTCVVCAATSYTRDGAFRFRTQLTLAEPPPWDVEHLVVGNQLIYASRGSIGAVDTGSGAALWSRQLPYNFPSSPDVAGWLNIDSIAADPGGVMLLISRYLATAHREAAVLRLNPATGQTIFAHHYPGYLSGGVLDELNNFYFGFVKAPSTPPQAQVISLTSAGAERWRSPASTTDNSSPIAAFNGELILETGEVRSTVDGSLRAAAQPGQLPVPPLMGTAARIHMRSMTSDKVEAVSIKPGSAMPTWQTLVAEVHATSALTHPMASGNGNLLIASGDSRHPTLLTSIDALGAERYACPVGIGVGSGGAVSDPVALLDGRWAVVGHAWPGLPRVRMFEVPGEQPTPHGWVGQYGSPGATRRPVP